MHWERTFLDNKNNDEADRWTANELRLSMRQTGLFALILRQLKFSSQFIQSTSNHELSQGDFVSLFDLLVSIHGDGRLKVGDTRSFAFQLLFESRFSRSDAGVEDEVGFEFGTFRF